CRTHEQSQLAQLIAASEMLGDITEQVTLAHRLPLVERARVFALVRVASADARIAMWNFKFKYNFWRPVTAIRNADADPNPATTPDPNWEPFLTTPSFPE